MNFESTMEILFLMWMAICIYPWLFPLPKAWAERKKENTLLIVLSIVAFPIWVIYQVWAWTH
jgi:hypothetical protein